MNTDVSQNFDRTISIFDSPVPHSQPSDCSQSHNSFRSPQRKFTLKELFGRLPELERNAIGSVTVRVTILAMRVSRMEVQNNSMSEALGRSPEKQVTAQRMNRTFLRLAKSSPRQRDLTAG
jgi:hypothetical protein